MRDSFRNANIAPSAMAAVSTLSALSTRLPAAPVTILSAMTPQTVKAAISTVLSKHTAHETGSVALALACKALKARALSNRMQLLWLVAW